MCTIWQKISDIMVEKINLSIYLSKVQDIQNDTRLKLENSAINDTDYWVQFLNVFLIWSS